MHAGAPGAPGIVPPTWAIATAWPDSVRDSARAEVARAPVRPQVLRGESSPALRDAVAELATEAVSHLLAARSLQPSLPKSACSSLLPATVASLILDRLQKAGYAPFEAGAAAPFGVQLHLRLMWNGLRGTY